MMRFVALAAVLMALCAGAVTISEAAVASCDPRPQVDAFVEALNAGDLDALDSAFATGPRWRWYSVADLAGQRLQAASKDRGTLRAYFAERIARHETLRLLEFRRHADGNFTYLLRRSADDLVGGRADERQGKGWLDCESGKIGVWSLGGAPPPATFATCPRSAQPLPSDLTPARRAVIAFVRGVFAEMVPGLDVRGARVAPARRAAGALDGYTARVRCSRAVQRRTAIVRVTFPQVDAGDRLRSVVFYVSRTPARWVVWRLV
jgi:hypothetical protein